MWTPPEEAGKLKRNPFPSLVYLGQAHEENPEMVCENSGAADRQPGFHTGNQSCVCVTDISWASSICQGLFWALGTHEGAKQTAFPQPCVARVLARKIKSNKPHK